MLVCGGGCWRSVWTPTLFVPLHLILLTWNSCSSEMGTLLVPKNGPIPVRSFAPGISQSFQQNDVGIALSDRGQDGVSVR
jgi:hypothetical protein